MERTGYDLDPSGKGGEICKASAYPIMASRPGPGEVLSRKSRGRARLFAAERFRRRQPSLAHGRAHGRRASDVLEADKRHLGGAAHDRLQRAQAIAFARGAAAEKAAAKERRELALKKHADRLAKTRQRGGVAMVGSPRSSPRPF